MELLPPQNQQSRRIPTWVIALLPLAAVVISNADVILLAVFNLRAETSNTAFVLATTIPLSLGAGILTLWFIIRLRLEVDRRTLAEQDARVALADRSQALDRERLLRRELDHRVRNNLSALLALVGLYEETNATPTEMVISLRNRVLALRESYSLIATTHGEGVELAELLRAVVAVVLGDCESGVVTINGPTVRLTSREANAFAMIVQELLTNATKHGALRGEGGTIDIAWKCVPHGESARVALHWIEQPVSDAAVPRTAAHSGMGLTLIEGFAASDLRGSVSFVMTGRKWIVNLLANIQSPAVKPESLTNKEAFA